MVPSPMLPDVRKAFPTTLRSAMLAKLHEAGVRGHLFRGIAATYSNVTSHIQIGGHASEEYSIELGVRAFAKYKLGSSMNKPRISKDAWIFTRQSREPLYGTTRATTSPAPMQQPAS